jgi:nitrate/nitrite transport system permease protein
MTTLTDLDSTVALPPGLAPSPPKDARGARLRSAASALLWGLVGAATLLALWQLAAARSPSLPGPLDGIETLADLLSNPFYDAGPNDKGIGVQLVVSLGRVARGFALAAVIGIPLGLLMGSSRRAWHAINPIAQLLRPVSPLAWFPVWLKVSQDAPKAAIIVIFITALWPVVVNTAAGAATVPKEQQDVARVFKFGRVAYLRHVLIPNALPSIVTGLRLSMGIAWMVIVAVEMLSGSTGIGAYVWSMYNASQLSAVMAAIVLIGVVGVVLDLLFMKLSRRVTSEVRS